ncbi:MAG: hypothetical protein QG602_1783 [Verrucomicrobiota bacterium]|nr:hypothetical protein [Verrucomicrobiota bacterium]
MTDRFAALRNAGDALGRLEFFANDNPKCPHCGCECSVSHNEWWNLYEEGEHEVTCPSCDQDFTVSTRVSYSFSTDNQEDHQ